MFGEREFVFLLLAIVGVLFASNRVRLDVVALLTVLVLMLSGILSVPEALEGFGNPVVLLVGGLLVIGEMLVRTGIAQSVGSWILRVGGGSEIRSLMLIMMAAVGLGSVMSSTAIVAIFIPIVLRVASKTDLNASRLLMPMAYAALISGMLTLIATSPNLVVSAELANQGFAPLGFFSFTPIGIAILIVGIVYMMLVGRHLLPGGKESPEDSAGRTARDLWREFGLEEKAHRLRVGRDSPLIGKTIEKSNVVGRYGARILAIGRPGRLGRTINVASGDPYVELKLNDVLMVLGEALNVKKLMEKERLESLGITKKDTVAVMRELGVAVILIHPACRLIGKSLRQAGFRSRFEVHVLGIRRKQKSIDDFTDEPVSAGDTMLVSGTWNRITQLQNEKRDFVLLELPVEFQEVVPARRQAPVAIAILLGMVLLSAFNLVPIVAAVMLAVLAAVFTRCLTMEDAYKSIPWSNLVLLAGMFPLADALEKTGGSTLVVNSLVSGLGSAGPYGMMTALFFLTTGLGLFLSNTASAVLMAPVAIMAAQALNVSPYPLAISVLIAASSAFVTPVSTPVVTLVVQPGRYTFVDFVKVGGPLLILTYLTTLLVTPMIFPF